MSDKNDGPIQEKELQLHTAAAFVQSASQFRSEDEMLSAHGSDSAKDMPTMNAIEEKKGMDQKIHILEKDEKNEKDALKVLVDKAEEIAERTGMDNAPSTKE